MPDFLRRFRRWLRRRSELVRLRRFRSRNVGPASHVDPSVHVLGWEQVLIGHHTVISEDTWINVNHRAGNDHAIVIGDNCFLGRRNFLSAGARITVGDYCLTGVDCHFLGSDHIYSSPFVPYMTTGATADGVIEIGSNCWLGSSVTVLKNVKIGYGSIIGAAAVVTRDVPPLSIVVGNPARVIRRFDVQQQAWVGVDAYPADGDEYLPGEASYLETLRTNYPAIKAPVIASGSSFGDL